MDIIKKIIGGFIIFIGIGLFMKLLPNISILLSSFSNAIKTNLSSNWGAFTGELVVNIISWTIAYFIVKFGLFLFKSNSAN